MRKIFLLSFISLFSSFALAGSVPVHGYGIGHSEAFNVLNTSVNVNQAYRQDSVDSAQGSAVASLTRICENYYGGTLSADTIQITNEKCSLNGTSGSLVRYYFCTIDASAQCAK